MTNDCAPVFRFSLDSACPSFFKVAFALVAALVFCLMGFASTVAQAQIGTAPVRGANSRRSPKVTNADTSSKSVSKSPAEQSTADATQGQNASFVASDNTLDRPDRPNQLVRYLLAGGLLLGGIILAVPPIYYLALGGGKCNVPETSRGCTDGYRSMAWYDYAGLALGGVMIGAGVAVLVWPTPSASGEHATTLSFCGQF